jgi:hypothetical protein
MAIAYRTATGDTLVDVYESSRTVPPLAVAALALGELLKQVELPEGSLHATESLEFSGAVPEGSTLTCAAHLAQRSVRGGYVWSVLHTDLSLDGVLVVSARATVLSPVQASA